MALRRETRDYMREYMRHYRAKRREVIGRRPKGTGGMSLRKDGRWAVTIHVDGHRYTGTTLTRAAAEKWIASHLKEGQAGVTLNERWVEVVTAARRNGDPDLLSALHQFAVTWKGFKP